MKRQGLITTIFELRMLADELEAQIELDNIENIPTPKDTKFQLNIINKTPEQCDTWEFESHQIKKERKLPLAESLEARNKAVENNTRHEDCGQDNQSDDIKLNDDNDKEDV